MADEMTQSTPQQDMQDGTVTEETARTGPSGGADTGERAQKVDAARDAEPGTGGAGGADPRDEERIQQEMERVEEDPPENLEDWPDGPAKYKTFGGPEGDHSYEEGPERKLGPSSLRRHEDGSVEIEGEKVDNPDDYKRDSIENPMSQTAGGE